MQLFTDTEPPAHKDAMVPKVTFEPQSSDTDRVRNIPRKIKVQTFNHKSSSAQIHRHSFNNEGDSIFLERFNPRVSH